MSLILAIEPDHRQALHLDALARNHLHTELLVVDSATRALDTLAERVPDVILTSALLSPREDATLSDRLRDLGAAASHVQTLTIPIFSVDQPAVQKRGVLFGLLTKRRALARDHGGCEPAAFAEQIALYLERAALERGFAAEAAPPPVEQVAVSALVENDSDTALPGLTDDVSAPIAMEAAVEDEGIDAAGDGPIDQPVLHLAVAEMAAADLAVADVAAANDVALANEETAESLSEEQSDVGQAQDMSGDEVPFFNLELEWLDDGSPSPTTIGEGIVAEMQASDSPNVGAIEVAPGETDAGFEEAARLELSEGDDFDPFASSGSVETEGDDSPPLGTPRAESSLLTMELEWLAEEPATSHVIDAQGEGGEANGQGIGDQGSGIRVAVCKADDLEVDLTMLSRFIDESRLGQDPAYEMEVAPSLLIAETGKRSDSPLAAREVAPPAGPEVAAVVAAPAPEPTHVPAAVEPQPTSRLRSLLDFEKHVAERISRKRAERAAAQAKALLTNAKKPAQDEWGLFDPDQCGFSALVEKLEEISTDDSPEAERADGRVRIIS